MNILALQHSPNCGEITQVRKRVSPKIPTEKADMRVPTTLSTDNSFVTDLKLKGGRKKPVFSYIIFVASHIDCGTQFQNVGFA